MKRKTAERKEMETSCLGVCNEAVITFVIFCYFPLDELENRVYNGATNESTQCHPRAAGTFQPLVETGKEKSLF